MSRHHARFALDNQGLSVADLQSANGTFVNGQQVTEARLSDGDTLAFAKLLFTVRAPVKAVAASMTIIRPAIDLDEEVDREAVAEHSLESGFDLQLEVEPPAASEQSQQRSGLRWFLVIAVASAAAAAAYWWYLQQS